MIAPERCGGGRCNGDTAFLLLLHPVHRRGAFMHFADLVGFAGVIKNALSGRGFPRIDMRHDADIAIVLDGSLTGHKCDLLPTEV